MSISLNVVSIAIDCCARTIRSAMLRRILLIATRRMPSASAGGRAIGGEQAPVAAGDWAAMRESALLVRLPAARAYGAGFGLERLCAIVWTVKPLVDGWIRSCVAVWVRLLVSLSSGLAAAACSAAAVSSI